MQFPKSLKGPKICGSILDAIGNTPLVSLSKIFQNRPHIEVIAKLEFLNPGGSIKDRMVRYMLNSAIDLESISRVVESSSGNTGASLAMASAVHGLACDITVPATTSGEKIKRIRAFGANVHVCDGAPVENQLNYDEEAKRIATETGAFHLDQYRSKLNSQAHYVDTAPELWEQLDGKIDYFVCGIGSGGTISGIGRFLKEKNPAIRIIGVEPVGSSYQHVTHINKSDGTFSSFIEGIGKQEICQSYDPDIVDEVIQVPDAMSLDYCRRLAAEEGILAGGSSGSVVAGVAMLLQRIEKGRVVTIFPDSGMAYLSKYFD